MAPRVLVTAFEPFGGSAVNASAAMLEALRVEEVELTRVVLPCAFGPDLAALDAALDRCRPDWVIATGEAGGRGAISLERVAINVVDARIPDNAGAQPVDVPVIEGGPAAYWTSLPIKAMAARLRAEGFPAEISQTAGTFVCNHLFYGLMDRLAGREGVRGGFVHVPASAERLPPARAALGIAVALSEALRRSADLRVAEGRLD